MRNFLTTAVLGAALLTPAFIAPAAARADDHDRDRDHQREHVYQDRDHHDEHHWDKREDRAYRMYLREQHRRYRTFDRMNDRDQAAYWEWRHEHPDSALHIDIR